MSNRSSGYGESLSMETNDIDANNYRECQQVNSDAQLLGVPEQQCDENGGANEIGNAREIMQRDIPCGGIDMNENCAYEEVVVATTLHQQIDAMTEPTKRAITNSKIKGVIYLMSLCFVVSIGINVTTQLILRGGSETPQMQNSSKLCNNTWKMEYSKLNTTYANCPVQYAIGAGIVVSKCNHHQFGPIVDIRLFISSKSTIKGIVVPMYAAPRLAEVIRDMMD